MDVTSLTSPLYTGRARLSTTARATNNTWICLVGCQHNFTLDMIWLPAAIGPKKLWPKVAFGEKRGITREEHENIFAQEPNPERGD